MKRVKIEVKKPGGIQGHTTGDVIEDPTEAQISFARANPGVARVIEAKPRRKLKTEGDANQEEVT